MKNCKSLGRVRKLLALSKIPCSSLFIYLKIFGVALIAIWRASSTILPVKKITRQITGV